jgi:hypothetical protein
VVGVEHEALRIEVLQQDHAQGGLPVGPDGRHAHRIGIEQAGVQGLGEPLLELGHRIRREVAALERPGAVVAPQVRQVDRHAHATILRRHELDCDARLGAG